MSVESKLNTLLAAQAAQSATLATVLTTVQGIPGADTSQITLALAALQDSVNAVKAELGTDTDGTTPPTA